MRGIETRTKAWGAGAALVVGVGAAVSTAFGADDDGRSNGAPSAVAVAAQEGTPALPGTPGSGVAGTVTGSVPVVLRPAQVIALPSARRCVRSLRIVLLRPSGASLRGLAIRSGARVIVRRNTPRVLTLRVLPRGRFRLKVIVAADNGQRLVRTRTYRPCGRR